MLHVETLNKRVQHIHEAKLRRLHTHEQLKTIGIHDDVAQHELNSHSRFNL